MTLRGFADMYCWCCHLEDAMYSCKKCPRAYHRKCLWEMPNYPEPIFDPTSMDPSSMTACPECVVAADSILNNMKKVARTELRTTLRYVINKLKSDETFFRNYYQLPKPKTNTRSHAVVVKYMDILTLKENVEKDYYKTLEGFFGDSKWIRHNMAVTAGRKSDEMILSEKFVNAVALELLEIDLCPECYIRKQNQHKIHNWFTQACSRPHLLGWAKTDNSVYWPVKLMGIDGSKSIAVVHFFGEHIQAELHLKNCLIYSTEPPHSLKRLKYELHDWKGACKEMKKHLEKLEEKHGKVVLPDERRKITCSLTEAVQRMFPDWKLKMTNEAAEMAATAELSYLSRKQNITSKK